MSRPPERSSIAAAVCRVAAAWIVPLVACGTTCRAVAQSPTKVTGTMAVSPCGFVGDTLVPRLAMGVRRIDGDDIDLLELRDQPGAATVAREVPLFRPYYVVETRNGTKGDTWHRLQDGYTAAAPLGWARGSHVHLLDSRYAYTFANRKREQPADLHDDSKEAYERLRAQAAGNVDGMAKTVVVRELPGAESWNPVTIDDTVPFVELRIPAEKRDREHPDTTPTFRFGIPLENRLVHVGAICGGPVEGEQLKKLRETVVEDNGLEMMFVVDETTSMDKFMKIVARFIRDAGQLAVGQPVPVRIAVCSYTDGPPGSRVKLGRFNTVKGPADVKDLADQVEKLGFDLPDSPYEDPPERMLEGLRDAMQKVPFQAGTTRFVVVVGDKGHQPDDKDKGQLIKQAADLIARTGASVHFIHVNAGDPTEDKRFVDLFKDDYDAIVTAAGNRVAKGRLVYQRAEENQLLASLQKARNAVEEERRRLQRQIARMESRSPYTEPGPKLLESLEKRGLDKATFDRLHLQYFVKSRGWLFHPATQDAATAQPQLREFFLLAPPERQAVKKLFDGIRDRLSRREQIDGDAVITAFGADLASASGHPAVAQRVADAWRRIPQRQRSVGVFLEDVFGLRLKAALPFPPIAFAKQQPAAEQEIERMLERIGRLGNAFRDEGDAAFWFDASGLVP